MGTANTQYGPGDKATFPSGTNDPQDFDADAMIACDEGHYIDIVSELLDESYDAQEEVGKNMAKSDPTWFGEIASIVCLVEKAKKTGNLIESRRLQKRLFRLCSQLTGYTIESCAKARTDAD